MHGVKWIILLLLSYLTGILSSSAQQVDSGYIWKFKKNNDVELYNGYNSNRLRFYTAANRHKRVSLFTNNRLFTGLYPDYKWASVGYGINVPFNSRDNRVKDFKNYHFNLDTYKHGWALPAMPMCTEDYFRKNIKTSIHQCQVCAIPT